MPITSINPTTFAFVKNINDSPDSVALLADITSSVKIGNVIVVRADSENPGPEIIELKDGPVNDYIVSVVEEHGTDPAGMPPQVFDEIDKDVGSHGRKHFERVGRQIRRARNFESLANNDIGEDPETGASVQNIGPELEVDDYDAKLMEMISAAAETGVVVDSIEDCLWVGVYYSALVHNNLQENFRQEIAKRGASTSFPVWNLFWTSTNPRLQPIFLRSLAPESILDIMLGDMQILVYIDWDAFFERSIQSGIHARWTTRKEQKEQTTSLYQELSFRRDGHTPVFERGDGAEFRVMGGVVARIVNEGLTPSSLLNMIQDSDEYDLGQP